MGNMGITYLSVILLDFLIKVKVFGVLMLLFDLLISSFLTLFPVSSNVGHLSRPDSVATSLLNIQTIFSISDDFLYIFKSSIYNKCEIFGPLFERKVS